MHEHGRERGRERGRVDVPLGAVQESVLGDEVDLEVRECFVSGSPRSLKGQVS